MSGLLLTSHKVKGHQGPQDHGYPQGHHNFHPSFTSFQEATGYPQRANVTGYSYPYIPHLDVAGQKMLEHKTTQKQKPQIQKVFPELLAHASPRKPDPIKEDSSMRGDFVVQTPEDVLPGLKALEAHGSVAVVPAMGVDFETEARKCGLLIARVDHGFFYEYLMLRREK